MKPEDFYESMMSEGLEEARAKLELSRRSGWHMMQTYGYGAGFTTYTPVLDGGHPVPPKKQGVFGKVYGYLKQDVKDVFSGVGAIVSGGVSLLSHDERVQAAAGVTSIGCVLIATTSAYIRSKKGGAS